MCNVSGITCYLILQKQTTQKANKRDNTLTEVPSLWIAAIADFFPVIPSIHGTWPMKCNLIGWMLVRFEPELIAYPWYPRCLIWIFLRQILGSEFAL